MAIGNTAKDGTGTPYWQVVNDAGYIRVYDWEPTLEADEALNDSDKTLTVPAGVEWKVKQIWIEFTSTAVVGNRQLEIQIQDGAADVICEVKVGAVQAASLTRYYHLSSHAADLAAFRDTDWLMTPIPEWVLPAGYVIRIWDNAAVDAALDDMILQLRIDIRGTT